MRARQLFQQIDVTLEAHTFEYTISVVRSAGLGLGINARQEQNSLCIRSLHSGLFADWNNGHIDLERMVLVGDRIIEINGQTEGRKLTEACLKAEVLNMTIARRAGQRPPDIASARSYKLILDRSTGRELGIRIKDNGLSLCIIAITGGLVADWNAEHSHPDQLVRVGDCIIEINGLAGGLHLSSHLTRESRKLQVLHMTLSRRAETDPPPKDHAEK